MASVVEQLPDSPAATSTEPYSVRLELTSVGKPQLGLFDVYLQDHQVPGIVPGAMRLDFAQWRLFLDAFLRGGLVLHQQALSFGVELSTMLFGEGLLKEAWARVLHRRNGRPVRLELVLPTHIPGSGDTPEFALDEIPFELLAGGDGGFWFRRPGWSLVRTFADLPAMAYRLPTRSRALLAWANPKDPKEDGTSSRLPQSIFDAHEAAFQREAKSLGMVVLRPCRRATRAKLKARLRANPETPLLALVAHGESQGGAVLLHAGARSNEAESVLASDLAAMCKTGGVRVAFLWSCHSARRHTLRSSVVAALLHQGDLAAVVASHAALVAERTARLVGPLLRSLGDVAAGDLERAVTEARHDALPEDDVQWAAPVYYARPLQGRSVTAESIAHSLAEPLPATERRIVLGAPAARSWFRGRGEEITQALGTVKAHRLVTLTGMPGIGKTALAIEVSRRVMEDAALALKRAFWIDLSTLFNAVVLRESLAVVFGFSAERCPDDLALALAIGSSRALLVLDNAEGLQHRDGDGFRALLDTLLCYAAELRILLTSRRALGHLEVTEEHALHIGRIAPGADREVFIAVAEKRLAAEPADGVTLDALVRALEGHPQSIVLVAGQVGRGLSLQDLKARVEAEDAEVVRDAALLEEELEGADSKLRTRRLVSSLNLSFTPLLKSAPRAAELFVWLATFPAGLPEVLAIEVFGDEAKRWGARLLAVNLIERRGSDLRWILPGPVRWYARSRRDGQMEGRAALDSGQRHELLERSVRALAGWLKALRTRLGKPGAAAACARAQDEGANLVALALVAESQQAASGPFVAGLASSFADYSALACYGNQHAEAVIIGEKLLPFFKRSQEPVSLALVCEGLGDLYVRTARLMEAQQVYEQALHLYRSIDNRRGEANTLQSLGALYVRTARLTEAQQAYDNALSIHRAIGDRRGKANTLKLLGALYVRTARLTEAQRAHEQALSIYRVIDDQLGEANGLRALGALYLRTDRVAEAQGAYEQALPLYQAINARLGEANTLQSLGALYVRTDRVAEAQRAYEQALPLYQAIGDQLGEANTLLSLGALYVRTDRVAEAQRAYEQALPLYQAISDQLGEANTLQRLGSLALARQKPTEAFDRYIAALNIQITINDTLGQGGTHGCLARAAAQAGRPERALALTAQALSILLSINDRFGQMLIAKNAQPLLAKLGDKGEEPVLIFAWATARLIGDASAQKYEPIVRKLNIDPKTALLEELREQKLATIQETFARYRTILNDRNEDLYSPLEP